MSPAKLTEVPLGLEQSRADTGNRVLLDGVIISTLTAVGFQPSTSGPCIVHGAFLLSANVEHEDRTRALRRVTDPNHFRA